jgi:hypothetical protein
MYVHNIRSLLDICKSFIPMFTTADDLMDAAEIAQQVLRVVYRVSGYTEAYHCIPITSEQLLSAKDTATNVLQSPEWPEYTKEILQRMGLNEEKIRESGRLLVELCISDKEVVLLYIIPQDRTVLFPSEEPEAPVVPRMSPCEHDTITYCKYLEKHKCHNCGVTPASGAKLQACGKCKQGCYCSRDCQVADWSKHKTVCDVLQSLRGVKKSSGKLRTN